MTRDEGITKLKELQKEWDHEKAHVAADAILCDMLTSLGYEDVVREWVEIEIWYA